MDSRHPELTVSLEQQAARKSEVLSLFDQERQSVRDRLMGFVRKFSATIDYYQGRSTAMPYPREAQQEEKLYVAAWFQGTWNNGVRDYNVYFGFYTPATDITDPHIVEKLAAPDGTNLLMVKAAEVKVLACSEERLGEEGRLRMQTEMESARATLDCLDILYPKE